MVLIQCTICQKREVCDLNYRDFVHDMKLEYILKEYPSLMDSWKILQGIIYYREYRGIGGNIRIRENPNPCVICMLKIISLSKSVFDLTSSLENSTREDSHNKDSEPNNPSVATSVPAPTQPSTKINSINRVNSSDMKIPPNPAKSATSPGTQKSVKSSRSVIGQSNVSAGVQSLDVETREQRVNEEPEMFRRVRRPRKPADKANGSLSNVKPKSQRPKRMSLPPPPHTLPPSAEGKPAVKPVGRPRKSLPVESNPSTESNIEEEKPEQANVVSGRPKRAKGLGFQERYPDFIDYTPSPLVSIPPRLKTHSVLNTSLPAEIQVAEVSKNEQKRKSVGDIPVPEISMAKRRRMPSAKWLASMETKVDPESSIKKKPEPAKMGLRNGTKPTEAWSLNPAAKSSPSVADKSNKMDKENRRSVANEIIESHSTPKNLRGTPDRDQTIFQTPKEGVSKVSEFSDFSTSETEELEDWQKPDFRAGQLQLLDTVLLEVKWSVRSSKNMEKEVFKNAKSKEDYTAGIQRLVSHFSNQGSSLTLAKQKLPESPNQNRLANGYPAKVNTQKSKSMKLKKSASGKLAGQKERIGLKIKQKMKLKKTPKASAANALNPGAGTKQMQTPRVWGKDRKNCPVCGILQGGKELAHHLKVEHGGGRCPVCRELVNTNLDHHVKSCVAVGDASPRVNNKELGDPIPSQHLEENESSFSISPSISVETIGPRKYVVKKSRTGKKGKKYLEPGELDNKFPPIERRPSQEDKQQDENQEADDGTDDDQQRLRVLHHNFGKDFSSGQPSVFKKKIQVKRRVVRPPVRRPQRKTRPIEERRPDFVIEKLAPRETSKKSSRSPVQVEEKVADLTPDSSGSGSLQLRIDEDRDNESDNETLSEIAKEVSKSMSGKEATTTIASANDEILEVFNSKAVEKKSEADKWFDINQG